MISVANTAVEMSNTPKTIAETSQNVQPKTVIICGACGAQEILIDTNKTECPNCDDYIY